MNKKIIILLISIMSILIVCFFLATRMIKYNSIKYTVKTYLNEKYENRYLDFLDIGKINHSSMYRLEYMDEDSNKFPVVFENDEIRESYINILAEHLLNDYINDYVNNKLVIDSEFFVSNATACYQSGYSLKDLFDIEFDLVVSGGYMSESFYVELVNKILDDLSSEMDLKGVHSVYYADGNIYKYTFDKKQFD